MSNDALSQILDVLQMQGAVYFHTNFSAPWGIEVPDYKKVARFHMVMRGNCWARIDGIKDPIHMTMGDLLVIPHGVSHILSDKPDREANQLDFVLEETGYDGEGALVYGGAEITEACKLFCGHFQFDDSAFHPLLNDLPSVIHLPNTQTMNSEWLESILRFVFSEVVGHKAGADAIVHRLTEIIFIQTVRAFVEIVGDDAGTLAGVLDTQLSRSLAAIHSSPEKPWTVDSMAKIAGMSRTAFSNRFSQMIGVTPLNYLTQWRMQMARKQLISGNLTILDIAESVGYGSEAAFNRAFKKQFNNTPAAMRRSASRKDQIS